MIRVCQMRQSVFTIQNGIGLFGGAKWSSQSRKGRTNRIKKNEKKKKNQDIGRDRMARIHLMQASQISNERE